MSPIEKIGQGIENSDWQAVCDGYNILSGKNISPPTANILTNKERAAIIKDVNHISSILDGNVSDKGIGVDKTTKKASPKTKAVKTKSVMPSKDQRTAADNQVFPITSDQPDEQFETIEDQRKFNLQRAQQTSERKNALKRKRQANRVHKVICSECEKPFDSKVETKGFGQTCRPCLREKIGK